MSVMILAKLVPFFICVLLGTPQAVAQVPMFTHQIAGSTILNPSISSCISKLDFGTYESINRASRSPSETFTSNIMRLVPGSASDIYRNRDYGG